jgi:hypothetical protein
LILGGLLGWLCSACSLRCAQTIKSHTANSWLQVPVRCSRFLREADAGLPVKELCRKHGLSRPSYCAWKAKFGGMNVSDAQRLKLLQAENAKLKKLLATRCSRSTRCAPRGARPYL